MSSVFIPADVLLSLLFFVTQALQPAFMFPRVEPSEVFTALLPVSLLFPQKLFIWIFNWQSEHLSCSSMETYYREDHKVAYYKYSLRVGYLTVKGKSLMKLLQKGRESILLLDSTN